MRHLRSNTDDTDSTACLEKERSIFISYCSDRNVRHAARAANTFARGNSIRGVVATMAGSLEVSNTLTIRWESNSLTCSFQRIYTLTINYTFDYTRNFSTRDIFKQIVEINFVLGIIWLTNHLDYVTRSNKIMSIFPMCPLDNLKTENMKKSWMEITSRNGVFSQGKIRKKERGVRKVSTCEGHKYICGS